MPLAEQIMKDAGCNQWFVLFYEHQQDWDSSIKLRHLEFFALNQLMVQPVMSIKDGDAVTSFYHVRFKNRDDPCLKAYSLQFEDAQGISLRPSLYQMFEWSYEGWLSIDGPAQLSQYLAQQEQAHSHTQPAAVAEVGPQGPVGP